MTAIFVGEWQLHNTNFQCALDQKLYIVTVEGCPIFTLPPQLQSCHVISDHAAVMIALSENQIIQLPCYVCDGIVSPLERCISSELDISVEFSKAIAAYNNFNLIQSIAIFDLILQTDPCHAQSLFNMGGIMHMLDCKSLAMGFIERLLTVDQHDAIAHTTLWALAQADKFSNTVINVYRRLAEGHDVKARHKLAVMTGEGLAVRIGDPNYAKMIYDDMATSFEHKLVKDLGYQGPWELEKLISEVLQSPLGLPQDEPISQVKTEFKNNLQERSAAGVWRILDLGCGSGLCGRVFANYTAPLAQKCSSPIEHLAYLTPQHRTSLPSHDCLVCHSAEEVCRFFTSSRGALSVPVPVMIGVDVSPKIVEQCRSNGGYDMVADLDLQSVLDALVAVTTHSSGSFSCSDDISPVNSTTGSAGVTEQAIEPESRAMPGAVFDLILAADTFIYVGSLGRVFARARQLLPVGGLFAFSTEDLDSSPMKITTTTTAAHNNLSDNIITATPVDLVEFEDYEPAGAFAAWGYQLLHSARFAHSHSYIACLAAHYGFVIARNKLVVLRQECTVPLNGILYVLQAA